MRNVPIQLLTAAAKPATTFCRLWKIYGLADGQELGLTTLDRNVVYDDGNGLVTYLSKRGYTPYAVEATADLAVDNSEMEVLIAEYEVDGITSDAIRRGVYDNARYIEYLVDYENLGFGHVIISSGTIGRIQQVDNLVCFPEVRSLTQTLKQKSIIESGSNNCRVVQFGDERCKYPVETLLMQGVVVSVGLESDRVFTVDGEALADDALKPGLALFLTGANAGRSYEIEGNVSNVITLTFPTEELIAEGDEVEYRPDCSRLWEGLNSCQTYQNRPNFRGEPKRPVAETLQLQAPGATSKTSSGTAEYAAGAD